MSAVNAIRGIVGKNALNIKQPGLWPWSDQDKWWNGSTGVVLPQGDATFCDPLYCFRAATRLFAQYQNRDHCSTIHDFIGRWAPSDDPIGSIPGNPPNDPESYAGFVARAARVVIDSPLNLFDADGAVLEVQTLYDIFSAMAEWEIFKGYQVPSDAVESGIALYTHDLKAGTFS